jgi:hypothetical protein
MSRARNRHSRPYRLRQIRDDYCTERRILQHSLNTSTAHVHIDRDTNLQNLLHDVSQHSITICKCQLPPLRIHPSSKHISLQSAHNGRSDVSRSRIPGHQLITHAHIMSPTSNFVTHLRSFTCQSFFWSHPSPANKENTTESKKEKKKSEPEPKCGDDM